MSRTVWIVTQAALGVVAVASANIIFGAIKNATTTAGRVGLWAVLAGGAMAYFSIVLALNHVRESRFPRHPEVVLDLRDELLQFRRSQSFKEIARMGQTGAFRCASDYDSIRELLQRIQRVLDRHWIQSRFGSTTDVEVVLMVHSLIDGHVTVGAWAIRRPHSLTDRATDNTIYDQTEAARLFERDAGGSRVSTSVIAATDARGSNYHFISQNERERIRSTVLKPVYSASSQLLGFIVAHANRHRVFRDSDLDFWDDLLEPAAVEMALLIERVGNEVQAGADSPWN